MSLIIVTQGKVVSKNCKDYTKDDGTTTTYYNLKIGNVETCDSQVISVPEEVYNKVNESDQVQLKGVAGGIGKNKWWDFKELIKVGK